MRFFRISSSEPEAAELELLRRSPLLDLIWYRQQYPDLRDRPLDVVRHYLEHGARDGRNPHPLFDTTYYLEQNPDIAASGINPLVHYLLHGGKEGRNPHPLFDSDFYLKHNPDVAEAGVNPLLHYLQYGAEEGRDPNALFDTSFYLEQNPDVRAARTNPLIHYVFYGAGEGRDPHSSFDTSFYLESYPDVAKSGINPLAHYLLYGVTEGRRRQRPDSESSAVRIKTAVAAETVPRAAEVRPAARFLDRDRPLHVLFVSGDASSPSQTYRIDNMLRGLEELGSTTEAVPLHEFWRVIDRMADFHVVVFWRIATGTPFHWSADIERAIRDCEYHGVAVFFDVDDQVFDPELNSPRYVAGLRYLTDEQLVQYHKGVAGYRDLMLRCGQVLVPTDTLKRQAEKFGVRAFCVPNGLDEAYEGALARPLSPPPDRPTVVIGYTPGTRTHQKDFATAEQALRRLLLARPNVELRVLGPLDLADFPEMQTLAGRQVFVDPSVGRAGVLAFNQEIDINIAPLEAGNPFTAAKSELKYFEAAAFGVPTVASRVGPYAQHLHNGENGYAVETEEEWLAALTVLVDDSGLRRKIGIAARTHVMQHYTAAVIARKMTDAFEQVRDDLRLRARGKPSWTPAQIEEVWPDVRNYHAERPIVINWLVSGLLIGGGGHRNILRAAYHLSSFGHRVRLYFIETDLPAWRLRQLVRQHFYPLDSPIYIYNGTMKPADVVFGTYWKTVPIALHHRDICPNVFYFVQDFEPAFFPMGSDYIMAENTYRQGLYAICSGDWCAHFVRTQFNSAADSFTFPIAKAYYPRPRKKQDSNIVFFAKPDMPRRCYELGVEVLKQVHAVRADVEIITFGASQVSPESLPFPATCKGLLPTIDDLADMYSNADLGIAFSPTNPSLVPYEMLACGLPVVDLDRPGAEFNYGGRRDIALLGNPIPSGMVRDIVALLDDPGDRARRSRSGLEFVAQFPDETGMARRVETLIVQRLRAVGSITGDQWVNQVQLR